jgi:inosine-uridine nucleoside N-ribohydrolase
MRLHLDTDLGSDPDDTCAVAMLLGTPDVELVGITTTIDPGGIRAGMVREVLAVAKGHEARAVARDRDVPIAAGAEVTLTSRTTPGDIPTGDRWWPRPITPRPSPPGAALDLLAASLESGATVVAIGPYTNLALLETLRPGSLSQGPIVLMGGWVGGRLPEGFPAWEADRDWNVQCDPYAARVVFDAATDLTLVTIAATIRVPVCASDLPRLEAAGALGELLARQARAQGEAHYAGVGRRYSRLPDDLLNFHHDPLACAVAAGWDGADAGVRRLVPVEERGVLRFAEDPAGRPVKVVDEVDGDAFREHWFRCIERAAAHPQP